MNISSIVVQVNPKFEKEVSEKLESGGICEVHICSGDGRIIVTVEGAGIEEEMNKLKQIQSMPHIISAEMVYSYSEDELDQIRSDVEISDDTPSWLNTEIKDARTINYQGDLKRKM